MSLNALKFGLALTVLGSEPAFAQDELYYTPSVSDDGRTPCWMIDEKDRPSKGCGTEQQDIPPVITKNIVQYLPIGEIKSEDIPCWLSQACTPGEKACEELADFVREHDRRMHVIINSLDYSQFNPCLDNNGYELKPDTVVTDRVLERNRAAYDTCLNDSQQPDSVRSDYQSLIADEATLLQACEDSTVKATYKKAKNF